MSTQESGTQDIRGKRISIELEQLKGQLSSKYYKWSTFETLQGLYVRVHLDRILVEQSIMEYLDERDKEVGDQENMPEINFRYRDKYLVFDVLLDYRYPFQQPQIFSRTAFCNPPLNDGRDVFSEVLKSDWQLTKKLHEIIMYIPEFVADVVIEEAETNGGMLLKVLGTFHLGNNYEMSNWGPGGINRDSRVFQVEEQDEADEETFYPRLLVITHSALLILDPVKGSKNVGTLLSWATLQSLDKMRRNLSRPDLVTFVWRHIDGKQPWVLNLMIPGGKHEECIQTIVANMQSMGVGVQKNTKNEKRLLESEVTKEAIARMDIETIQEHIAAYEAALGNDLSLSTVQTLTTLYQKAIEYHSAFDDLLYNDFLNRMQSLLQREDIQIVLNSYEEDQYQQRTASSARGSAPQSKQALPLAAQKSAVATAAPPKEHQVDFDVSDDVSDDDEEEEEEEDYEEEEEEDESEVSTALETEQQQQQDTNKDVEIKQAEEVQAEAEVLKEESSEEEEDPGVEETKEVKVEEELNVEEGSKQDQEVEADQATKSQIEEVKGETKLAETVQSDIKVEIPVHEDVKTDQVKEQVVQIASEDQAEIQTKEIDASNAQLTHIEEPKIDIKGRQKGSDEGSDDDQDIDDYLDKIEQD